MKKTATVDQGDFQRLLRRNILLPMVGGVVGAIVFVGLIVYLLSLIGWVEHSDRVTRTAAEIQRRMVDMETGMRGYVISGDATYLEPYESAQPRVEADLGTLRSLVEDNSAQQERVDRMRTLHQAWLKFASETIDLRRSGGDANNNVARGRGKRLTDDVRDEFTAFDDAERSLRSQRSDQANRTAIWVVGLFVLLTLGSTALLAVFGRRQLMTLSQSYGAAMREQSEQAEELQEQAWLRSAQAELVVDLAGELAAAEIGRKTLAFFSRRMGSAVGALYVRERGGRLRRSASYGFSDEAEARPQVFSADASLMGRAAAERRLVVIDPIEADYLRVNTGLGDMAPKAVALLPVSHEGVVNGVIELGLAGRLGEREKALMNLVEGSVGSSLSAAVYREQLQGALAETQQLNEELQVQQEELRTANEELEEQSRALRASQAQLENQQAELEQTNNQLSERTEALDLRNAALRRAQQDLEDRATELQRASRYKSEFLANMSHELRTPLNSALILAKLLSDNAPGNLTAEQVKYAESIYGSGNDLLTLINDILDISKVEAGKMDLTLEPLALEALAQRLQSTFAPLASKRGLAFRINMRPGAPDTLHTDRQRVEQVLRNLLSNALKFTEKGEVSLTISGEGHGGARFDVADSGIGIPADQQDVIFEAFRQADGTTSRRYGGTGLGLSISRDLTHLLGGALSVASTPGQGSTFTLSLPAEAPAIAPTPLTSLAPAPFQRPISGAAHGAAAHIQPLAPEPDAPLAFGQDHGHAATRNAAAPLDFEDDRALPHDDTRRVLVIEDEPQFAHILYDLAHERGYRCIVSQGGADGIEMAAKHRPDAILLDMRLPDGPGLSVLERLKGDPRTRHIPVHVVSALDSSEAALHMGAIGYSRKPISSEQLHEVFRRLEDKLTQKVKAVLVVEDDPLQREAVMKLISDDDVQITAVESGEEALALLRERVFDCMVTDLRLSDMQGSELLKRMSVEEIVSFPPVIVYTGRNLTRDEEMELLRYSRSIIIKGARSPERLLDEVTLFLHKVESDLSSERQSMLRAARGRDRVFEGRRILLVDDDVRNIFALTSALEQRGAVVEIGRNGREALDKLDQVPDIDLVLMDVMMPEMDGLEATRRLRQDPRFVNLPVITVTAKAMKDDQEQCLAAGASDFLAKPVDLDRLFSLLRVWMPRMERL